MTDRIARNKARSAAARKARANRKLFERSRETQGSAAALPEARGGIPAEGVSSLNSAPVAQEAGAAFQVRRRA